MKTVRNLLVASTALALLSNTVVRFELDADANGTFESVTDVAWSTLLAA